MDVRSFLQEILYTRKEVDLWLAGKAFPFAKRNGKKVLWVLSFPAGSIAKYINEGNRWDQPFVDFMKAKKLPVIDLMEEHVREFKQFRYSAKEYLAKYYIGHYSR